MRPIEQLPLKLKRLLKNAGGEILAKSLTGKAQEKVPPDFRQAGILAGWLAALMVVSGLLWFFTQPLRDSALIRAANQALEAQGENIRLDKALSSREIPGKTARLGVWFSLAGSPNRGVIFPIMREGMQISFLGVVTPQGESVLIPLGANARKMAERLPPAILLLYTKRLEDRKAGGSQNQKEFP
ncbi:MAG: hypothetical protein LBG76_08420 [Treponema sp.]|nr:hypothetical protein [Treponema sp.]